jgi:hypothetical protein
VNRIWEQFFGRGLVETTEDFGTQGRRPSHPDLLDWLAVEFMDSGWRVKALHRLIATSATYRQSSKMTPGLLGKDPYNELLARGPRFRLPAETVRDVALAASGRLSPKIGGPSVFPPQPEGIWSMIANNDEGDWETSEGESLQRRGLYTFWRRTAPYPSFTTFDAPMRDVCTARRLRTNTPLQALVTLNDPVYFDAARAMARRLAAEAPAGTPERAAYAFRLAVSRAPTADEMRPLVAAAERERASFRKDPKAARAVTGAAAAVRDDEEAAELAAWTMASNVLLNLDETLTKE